MAEIFSLHKKVFKPPQEAFQWNRHCVELASVQSASDHSSQREDLLRKERLDIVRPDLSYELGK